MSFGAPNRRLGSQGTFDVESLQHENDRDISALSERVSLLKQATHGVKTEAEAQHRVLDSVAEGILDTKGMLGGAANRVTLIMSDKQHRKMITVVGGIVGVMLLIWYLVRR